MAANVEHARRLAVWKAVYPMPPERAASSHLNLVHSQFTPSACIAVERLWIEKIAVVESLRAQRPLAGHLRLQELAGKANQRGTSSAQWLFTRLHGRIALERGFGQAELLDAQAENAFQLEQV